MQGGEKIFIQIICRSEIKSLLPKLNFHKFDFLNQKNVVGLEMIDKDDDRINYGRLTKLAWINFSFSFSKEKILGHRVRVLIEN